MRARGGWFLCMTVALVIGGCSNRDLGNQETPTQRIYDLTAGWPAFAQVGDGTNPSPSRALDILFMVDNSSSMQPMQAALAAGFTSFTNVIQALPGGTPDLHIGVVSSDMGAGDGAEIAGCSSDDLTGPGTAAPIGDTGPTSPGGDQGRLQSAPRGACADTTLQAGAHFIAYGNDPVSGTPVTNYGASSLADVFSCIALLGDQGCGFEHQLSSVRHALDPALAPPENAGFLRPDAFLAVILLTNEDDCSAPAGSPLFNPISTQLDSKYGPTENFQCNEFGHLCLVDGKLQAPSRYQTASYEGCVSNDHGMLDSVDDFISTLQGLKSDPAKVFVATIAGPPAPYTVTLEPAPIPDTGPWPMIAHSCGAPDSAGGFADPAVRLEHLVQKLGTHGVFETICSTDMNTPLQDIATLMTSPMGPACVPPPAAPADGCTVVDRWTDSGGARQAAVLAACNDPAATVPCWSLVDDPACGAGAQRLQVNRAGVAVPGGLMTAIDCSGQAI